VGELASRFDKRLDQRLEGGAVAPASPVNQLSLFHLHHPYYA
jgi:hypothetical protein